MSNFDFPGKRVRLNGLVLDKYSLACEIAEIKPSTCMRIAYDAFSYLELKQMLFDLV